MLNQLRSDRDDKNLIEQGFTLVELLIVIVILGILAAIVVFAVGNLTSTATNHACATEMSTFETAVQAFKASNTGNLPGFVAKPIGPALADVITDLRSAALGGPFLASATLGYNGAGATQWTYAIGATKTDAAGGLVTAGASCV